MAVFESKQVPTLSVQNLKDMVECYPTPWTIDTFTSPAPKYNRASIYAKDSTAVCNVSGKNAHALANLIAHAVNTFVKK